MKTDIHFRKTARNLAAPGKNCCKERFGSKKQIFGMKSQATIFNPPLAWEDGQFCLHLSLDKPKRSALAGRWRRGCVRQRVRSHHVQGLRAVALDKPKDRKSSGTRGRGRAKHWINVKNRQHPAMGRVMGHIRVPRSAANEALALDGMPGLREKKHWVPRGGLA